MNIPQESPLLPNGQFTQSWRRYFQNLSLVAGGGSVTSVSITPANGVSGTVTNPNTTPAITLALGAITPTSVAASGAVSGSNLSVPGGLSTVGAYAVVFSLTGGTSLTLPRTGTLAAVNGSLASGGSVTQVTSKTTAVTLNAGAGQITTNNAALAAGAVASFTLNNTNIAATDIVLVQPQSGYATAGTYQAWAEKSAAGSVTVSLQNISAGSLSEAVVLSFAVVKSVTA